LSAVQPVPEATKTKMFTGICNIANCYMTPNADAVAGAIVMILQALAFLRIIIAALSSGSRRVSSLSTYISPIGPMTGYT
jgi:hypothetical protein